MPINRESLEELKKSYGLLKEQFNEFSGSEEPLSITRLMDHPFIQSLHILKGLSGIFDQSSLEKGCSGLEEEIHEAEERGELSAASLGRMESLLSSCEKAIGEIPTDRSSASLPGKSGRKKRGPRPSVEKKAPADKSKKNKSPGVFLLKDSDDYEETFLKGFKSSDLEVVRGKAPEEVETFIAHWEKRLIVIDLALPPSSLMELIKKYSSSQTPVILCTYNYPGTEKEKVLEAGGKAILYKPFDEGELIEKITLSLSGKEP